jgi:phage protein D
MTEPIPIYQGQDFYVPYFEVKLQNRPLKQDVVRDVIQVTYKDNVKSIDSFDITINNWDAEKLTFKYSDTGLFDPHKRLELWMGYYGKDRLRLMLTGEITALRPTFPASGPPTLSISGQNLLHRLRGKQESHAYENRTDSEIARQIGGRLSMRVRTDPAAAATEERYKYLYQHNEYDIIYLMKRAQRIGYDLFIEENGENGQAKDSTLCFLPSVNLRRKIYKLTYGRSLIQFQPSLSTANQVGKVRYQGWDHENKKKIEYTAQRSDIATKGVGTEGGQSSIDQSFRDREEVITTQPVLSEQEAKTLATETLERIAKEMVTGTGSTVGLPDLRAGSIIEIDGLGTRFSGRYFVTATTHAIGDSGYTTQFECRLEELKRG